jgi:rhamnulokinase
MDAPALMLDTEMPRRINSELTRLGFDAIPDVAGNEPLFARTILESLARGYASALANLERLLGRKLDRIHMTGGATRNQLLIALTEKQTGLKVEIGETESSTVGNLAIQLAASEAGGDPQVGPAVVRKAGRRDSGIQGATERNSFGVAHAVWLENALNRTGETLS